MCVYVMRVHALVRVCLCVFEEEEEEEFLAERQRGSHTMLRDTQRLYTDAAHTYAHTHNTKYTQIERERERERERETKRD